jgi:hypothetical protein
MAQKKVFNFWDLASWRVSIKIKEKEIKGDR